MDMQPHLAYRRQAHSAWTRIEMLLAIYDGAISSLDQGITALQQADQRQYPRHHLRASQLILLLIDGLDEDHGELATRIRDLCTFCIRQIGQPSAESWTNARNVLITLREGFHSIREEGIRLEAEGAIPPLANTGSQTLLHL
jgi:flagellin-specific chaperone FliS